MSIESFTEGLNSKLDILKLEYRTCTNYISPKGNCDNCIKSCPLNGIDIENGLSFTSNCTRCGVCSTNCPTGSISANSPTENYLYRKLKELSKDRSNDIVINCFETYKDNNSIINIPCVGMLSIQILIYLQFIENNVQVIVGDKCNRCQKKLGYDSYKNKLNKSKVIFKKLNKEILPIKNDSNIPKNISGLKPDLDEVNAERRFFLKSVFTGLKNIPKKTIDNILGKESEEEVFKVNTTYKFKIMEEVLEEDNVKGNIELKINQYPEFIKPCYFCKACIKMCPEDALHIKDNTITLDKKKCTGCGLCEDICFYDSISMRNDIVADYTSNKFEIINGKRINCEVCNRTIITQKGNKCNRCV